MGRKKHSINIAFTILLLGIFALTSIFVAVMGATVYANSADKMRANFDTRTSLIYLSEKIRANPYNNFSARDLDGATALVLTEEIEGIEYESWIFVANEKLCEARIFAGDTVFPGTAQQIMDLRELDVEIKDGGVEITVLTVSDERNSTFISARTKL